MRAQKNKAPGNTESILADGQVLQGADETCGFPARIARYGQARTRALGMLDYLKGEASDEATIPSARLATCGNWLHFREYYTVEKVRLHAAQFCKQHLICPLCAIRRGAKALAAYLARWEVIHEARPDLRPFLITFTVTNGEDLEERHMHLRRSLRRLLDRRRYFNAGTRGAPWTELCKAEGAVYSYEVTNRGKGWHPHVHMIALCASEPDQAALRAEWEKVTRDSFMIDVRPFQADQDVSEGFMEVFKYAVKFSDLSHADNWHAAMTLKSKRLLDSFGCFRGVQVPESLTDEPLDGLPYIDRFYRYIQGEYQFTGEVPKGKDQPSDAGELEGRSYVITKPADLSKVRGRRTGSSGSPGERSAGAKPSPLTHSDPNTLQRSALRPSGSERTRPAGGSCSTRPGAALSSDTKL